MFTTATLVIDTLNTSELATGLKVGTRSEVICAPCGCLMRIHGTLLWGVVASYRLAPDEIQAARF